MGRNNKARRAAKRRQKAQRRGPRAEQQPVNYVIDEDGNVLDLESPWHTIYYDEPDYEVQCESCGHVAGIPMYSMKDNPDFAARHPDWELTDNTIHMSCPQCGEDTMEVEPRVETAPDGSRLRTIDRDVLEAAGIREWQPTFVLAYDMVGRESGEQFRLAMSDEYYEEWVVCDECGLPFKFRGKQAAIATAADSTMNWNFIVGPCTNCGEGVGRPLMTTAEDGQLRAVASTPKFANALLVSVAEQLRNGQIDIGTAAQTLRAQNKPALTRLADWMESHPVTITAAGVLVTVVATLVAPQIPVVTDDGGDGQQPPDTYTEQQVEEIVTTIIDHYEATHPAEPDEGDPHG